MDMITTSLPNEILHRILQGVEMLDLVSIAKSCKALRGFVRGNRALFKDVYLNRMDYPSAVLEGFDWELELIMLTRLERILGYDSIDKKAPHIEFVSDTIEHFTKSASPEYPCRTLQTIAWHFLGIGRKESMNREALMCQSSTFNRARDAKNPPSSSLVTSSAERQASAKLHCLWGVPITMPKRTQFSGLYAYACSVVYDLRNYSDQNLWGPFYDVNGSVDWERIEAVMIILGHNMKNFSESMHGIYPPLWRDPFRGAFPHSFQPTSITRQKVPLGPVNSEDPYNVTGTWHRIVCFLDFHELQHYNFTSGDPEPDEPRPPLDTTEAIRLITMELETTEIKHAGEAGGPGADADQNFPVVYFTGASRSLHASWDPNANSNIRGKVFVTLEGEVRWTTWSIYWGEERWKSEGIQIGGINSGRGVFGHWFDKNQNIEGPVGPTAFWKISNEINEAARDGDSDADDFLYFVDGNDDEEDEEDGEQGDGEGNDEAEQEANATNLLVHQLLGHVAIHIATQLQGNSN